MKMNKLLTIVTLGAALTALAASPVRGKYPDDWIPMWEGKRESILLNTDNIVSIEPKFDPSVLLSRAKNDKAEYLEVRLVDGRVLKVYEDFEEFFSRIRNSNR